MDPYNEAFEWFTDPMIKLIYDMPSPSDFAKPGRWVPIQRRDPHVLCLRPASATGLPLCTLHDVFRQFRCETSVHLPDDVMTTEAVEARIAAFKLCLQMPTGYTKEKKRGKDFDSCVADILGQMEEQYTLRPKSASHSGRVDRCIKERGMVIAIHEDKTESGCGGGDVYMQIAADYQYLVRVLIDEAKTDPEANRHLSNGAPCFLMCLLGIYTDH